MRAFAFFVSALEQRVRDHFTCVAAEATGERTPQTHSRSRRALSCALLSFRVPALTSLVALCVARVRGWGYWRTGALAFGSTHDPRAVRHAEILDSTTQCQCAYRSGSIKISGVISVSVRKILPDLILG